MRPFFKAVPVVLLAFAPAGCTTGGAAHTSTIPVHHLTGTLSVEPAGSDLGNGRPEVSNDGLMVRRRVAIAIYSTPGANVASLRKKLETAATRGHTSLSSIAPGVLPAALLEPDSPAMTLVLPSEETLADARSLVRQASSQGRSHPEGRGYVVAAVLVHDLRFTVSSARPEVLAQAIAWEGILADALGDYTTTLGSHNLEITYTGPLLSDSLVESVRTGIARPAHVQPRAVTISPRSTIGVGVDMAKEPAPPPVVTQESPAHHHGATPQQ